MKVLVGMIVYDRLKTADWWMRAWRVAEKYSDAKLVVVHNYDGARPNTRERINICKWKPDHYYPRVNKGQDIGAFRDVIRAKAYEPWDVLLWCLDDNIPIRKDFIRAFIEPFEKNPNLGLVGNYWVKGSFHHQHKRTVPDHFRTTCFAISRTAAIQLYFPAHINTKRDCYAFEWLDGKMNMTAQIKRMGLDMQPVINDWDKSWVDSSRYVWDIGHLNKRSRDPRCRRDHWKQYNLQFAVKG